MKLCRFNENRLGLVENGQVKDVTGALEALPSREYPYPIQDELIANLGAVSARINRIAREAQVVPLDDVRLLSPVANPGKIIAAPVNYVKHLQEVLNDADLHHDNLINHIERAGVFLKATSSLVGAGEGIALTHLDRRNDHEVELAIVIGRAGRNISVDDALTYVAGYSIGLDITIRGPEERSLRKSPDTYTVLGPWLVTPDEIDAPGALDLELRVNGKIRQQANTSDLILGVQQLIAFASSFYTLNPGDIIITGTPEGVGPIVPGDVIDAKIEAIGEISVKVREA